MKISSFLYACTIMILAVTIPGLANAADTVALVSDVSGNVAVKVNGNSSPAKLLASIPLGARIDLLAGANLTMIYVAKGDEYKLSGPGSYQMDASSPQAINGADPARRASLGGVLNGKRIRSERVTLTTLTMRELHVVGRNLEPITPSSAVTLADPLQFRWREPAEGLAYKIKLTDSQNNALVNKEVTGNVFTLPKEIRLADGGDYVWSLSTTILDGSLVTSSAKFKIASNEIREQATKLRPGKNGLTSERIAYGLWLEGESLCYEAVLVWEELAADYPDEPNIRNRVAQTPYNCKLR